MKSQMLFSGKKKKNIINLSSAELVLSMLSANMSSSVRKYTVDSLSRSPGDSLKYVNISVPQHIRYAELRKKVNRTTTFHKEYVI